MAPPPDQTFSGYATESLDFLRTLGTKDKAWFEDNRKDYERLVVAPTKLFVVALGERLNAGFAPAAEAQPKTNGSIAPINNDLRFSPDKSPYKDHIMLRFWEGPTKKTAPMLMIRLHPDNIGYATGAALPDLDAWRSLVDADASGAALGTALDKLAKVKPLEFSEGGYKRVPKPYAEDHPRAELLKSKGLQARWLGSVPKTITSADFVDHCYEELAAAADVHRWLVSHLT